MRTGACDRCGTAFEDRSPAQRRRFCSDNCRKRMSELATKVPCPDCGVLIWRRSDRCFECHMKALEAARLPRWRRIHELWHQGVPMAEMAPQVGYANANALTVVLDQMKHAGWDIPPRRPGWKGNNGSGPPRKPVKTHQQANQRLGHAVRHGKVRRPNVCERCGRKGHVDGHHTDYSKPLEVEWLCRSCHMSHHSNQEVAA